MLLRRPICGILPPGGGSAPTWHFLVCLGAQGKKKWGFALSEPSLGIFLHQAYLELSKK